MTITIVSASNVAIQGLISGASTPNPQSTYGLGANTGAILISRLAIKNVFVLTTIADVANGENSASWQLDNSFEIGDEVIATGAPGSSIGVPGFLYDEKGNQFFSNNEYHLIKVSTNANNNWIQI